MSAPGGAARDDHSARASGGSHSQKRGALPTGAFVTARALDVGGNWPLCVHHRKHLQGLVIWKFFVE